MKRLINISFYSVNSHLCTILLVSVCHLQKYNCRIKMNNYTEFTSQCKNFPIGGNSSITETFDVSFWIDGVLISIIAAIGFILNNISLFILVSKKNLQNVFNHLLVFSFIAQNLYIFSSAFPRFYYNLKINLVVYFMPYFAHPLKEISLTLNILIPLCQR